MRESSVGCRGVVGRKKARTRSAAEKYIDCTTKSTPAHTTLVHRHCLEEALLIVSGAAGPEAFGRSTGHRVLLESRHTGTIVGVNSGPEGVESAA